MKLKDVLPRDMVAADLTASSKHDALVAIAEHSHRAHALSVGTVLRALEERERLGSTGVGDAVAIPHARIRGLADLVAGVFRFPQGVDFAAMDARPVHLVCVLLVPEDTAGLHLRALARISRLLKDGDVRTALLDADTSEELYETFLAKDERLV